MDVREAPPRNDAEFEHEMMQRLEAFLPLFAAHAFIIKSAVGRLQTQRLARERGTSAPIMCTSEDEALHALGLSSSRDA
jgi:hypothetical protein